MMKRFNKLPNDVSEHKSKEDSSAMTITTNNGGEEGLTHHRHGAKETGVLEQENMPEDKLTKIIIATHVNVFLYATSFWIQMGVLPYLTKSLGADPVIFGYLQTTFAIVQLCGGPFFGRFGDLFGCKAALILAFSASFIAYATLAIANSVPMLFLSRLPSMVMHSMQGSQMVLTDITNHEYRAAALGKLGISYGLGMIVGPFLGGIITSYYSKQLAAATAACGSILSVAIVLIFIPSKTKIAKSTSESNPLDSKAEKSNESSVFSASKIFATLKLPSVAYLLAIKCICGIPFGIFQSMFSIMTMEYFKLGPKENGFILSYVGVLGILVQGMGVGILAKRFKDTTLLSSSVIIIAVAYLLMIPVTNVFTFCLVLTPLITGGSILTVVITSCITKMVPYHETGAAIGLSMATHSLIRSISPTIGGILFSYFGFPIFGITGLVINGLLSLFLTLYGKREF